MCSRNSPLVGQDLQAPREQVQEGLIASCTLRHKDSGAHLVLK